MTALRAANAIGTDRHGVYRLIQSGRLLARRHGTAYKIDPASVEAYKLWLARERLSASHDVEVLELREKVGALTTKMNRMESRLNALLHVQEQQLTIMRIAQKENTES